MELANFVIHVKGQVNFPSNFAPVSSVIKRNSFLLSLAQKLHTLVESSALKSKFLRISSARVNICQIPDVNI